MEDKQAKKIGKGKRRTQAQRLMADSTSRHLEQLTKKARALAGEAEPEDMSIKAISKRLSRLQELHTKLQESLSSGSEQLIAARLRQEFEDMQAECTSVEEVEEEECSEGVISYIRREFLLHREGETNCSERKLFFLEGKVICGLKDGRIGIQYDTCYAGTPMESFYLVLAARSYSENLFVSEHTIPFFLPSQETERRFLSSSPATFVNIVGELLQGYVSRRQQIQTLQDVMREKIRHLSHTVRYDMVDFMVEEFSCKLTINLEYEDLQSDLPTRTKVVIWPHVPLKAKQHNTISKDIKPEVTPIKLLYAEKMLKEEHLPQAYKEIADGMMTMISREKTLNLDVVKTLSVET